MEAAVSLLPTTHPEGTRRLPAAYDAVAAWYAENSDPVRRCIPWQCLALLELAGDVSGLAVCDLACGTGIAARALAAAGARVTGIDLSAALLEIACEELDSVADGVCFIQGDVQRLAEISDGAFDGAVCSLALMDIEGSARLPGGDGAHPAEPELVRLHRHGPCFQGPE